MIGRVVWIIAILGIAALTSYAQLDRQSRVSPALAANVPEAFRAFAQAEVTVTALSGDDADFALAEAKRLIARRPIPAEHLRLLALAQYKAGEPDAAASSIQLAARRGWRDLQAQEAMLRLAIEADEPVEASHRYAALLLNKASDDELLTELGSRTFTAPAAQDAFAALLAGGARWQTSFLQRGSQLLPPTAFVAIVRTSIERGARFGCAPLKSAQAMLKSRDEEASSSLDAVIAEQC